MTVLAFHLFCLVILTNSEVGLSGQCEESVGSITPQRPDNNAYILRGTTEYFRCSSHSAATLEWIATIENMEYRESAKNYLSRNGVSWVTNTSYSILAFDSESGINVTSIECEIVRDDGPKAQQCSIFISINIYGKYKKAIEKLEFTTSDPFAHNFREYTKVCKQA